MAGVDPHDDDELMTRGQAIFARLREASATPGDELAAASADSQEGEDAPTPGSTDHPVADGTQETRGWSEDAAAAVPSAPGVTEAGPAGTHGTVAPSPLPDAVVSPDAGIGGESATPAGGAAAPTATADDPVAPVLAAADDADVDAVPAASPVARPLPRVLAIANQKGGVGKTTTAVNLGAALAELGYRVLVVDLDPQGNATTGLGINPRNLQASIYDVLMHDVPIEDCIEPTALRNLFVAPATIDLAGAEIELVPAFSRELRLRRALEPVAGDYDFTLIDCPPSLGLLTVNGLAAASEVVVPIQCEYYALEGLGQLLRNVALVQSNLNPRLEVSTIVLTMYDARTKLAEQVAAEVRGHFGDKVCRSVVPRTVRLSEAPSFGQPVTVFDPTSRGAIAYRELAKEVSGGAPQRTG
jgi:chromosome partitioning protein